MRVSSSGRRKRVRVRNPPAVREFCAPTLGSPEELERVLAGDLSGVVAIELGPDFGVMDSHLDAIASKMGPRLLCLQLGSSDTGDGVYLTCEAVQRLVIACPNLVRLRLESAVEIDNATFHAILSGLPNLEYLTVTGHDKRAGSLQGSACLRPLIDGAPPQLKRLYITDQRDVSFNSIQRLIKARGRSLLVQAGNTEGGSYFGQCQGGTVYGNYDSLWAKYGRSFEDGLNCSDCEDYY